MSDPFQPIELKLRNSFECLKLFKEHYYPVIISTKGKAIARDEYLALLDGANAVVQISITTEEFIKAQEPGAPSFKDRLDIIRAVVPVSRRVIVRVQPYLPQFRIEVLRKLETYRELGVYGIVVEGLKIAKRKPPCVDRIGQDFCIPYDRLKVDYEQIKGVTKGLGMSFYCGENRLRFMSDDLCCCGVDGLGWEVSRGNLNHIYFGEPHFTKAMKKPSSGICIKSILQKSEYTPLLKKYSLEELMMKISTSEFARNIYAMDRIMTESSSAG